MANSKDQRISNPDPLMRQIAKGKTLARANGGGKRISPAARAQGSASKTARMAAKAAGKPPVAQRKKSK